MLISKHNQTPDQYKWTSNFQLSECSLLSLSNLIVCSDVLLNFRWESNNNCCLVYDISEDFSQNRPDINKLPDI